MDKPQRKKMLIKAEIRKHRSIPQDVSKNKHMNNTQRRQAVTNASEVLHYLSTDFCRDECTMIVTPNNITIGLDSRWTLLAFIESHSYFEKLKCSRSLARKLNLEWNANS